MKEVAASDGRYDVSGRQFVVVYDFMGRDLGLRNSDLIIYARIFGFAKAGRPFFESKQGTADFYGMSKRSVFEAMKRLKDMGLIEEVEPCEEALKVGTKCYRPSQGPLASIGLACRRGEDSSPDDESSPRDLIGHAESSPLPVGTDEYSAPSPVRKTHPISKADNKHFR